MATAAPAVAATPSRQPLQAFDINAKVEKAACASPKASAFRPRATAAIE